jgi:hypothetical protein
MFIEERKFGNNTFGKIHLLPLSSPFPFLFLKFTAQMNVVIAVIQKKCSYDLLTSLNDTYVRFQGHIKLCFSSFCKLVINQFHKETQST